MARSLVQVESGYPDPPPMNQREIVLGLRGGAAVLMVASFEQFLKELVSECLDLIQSNGKVNYDLLPERIRIQNTYGLLEPAMKGVGRAQRNSTKGDRLSDIITACLAIGGKKLQSTAFIETGSNPNKRRVVEMMKHLDIVDVFTAIRPRFEREWGSHVSTTFIPDKLDEIVSRRNEVAHTGQSLTISRKDLRDSLKYLRVLGKVLDIEVHQKCRLIASTSR